MSRSYENFAEEQSAKYIIPRNYEERTVTAGGRSMRNIAEGAVMAAFTVPIFAFIPIPFMYRAILIAAFGGALFAFGMIGIKQCSVSEYVLKIIQFRKSDKLFERNDDEIFDELVSLMQKEDETENEAENENVQTENSSGKTSNNAPNISQEQTGEVFPHETVNNPSKKKRRKKAKQ